MIEHVETHYTIDLGPDGRLLVIMRNLGIDFIDVNDGKYVKVGEVSQDAAHDRDFSDPPWSMTLSHRQMLDALLYGEARGQHQKDILFALMRSWFRLNSTPHDDAVVHAFPKYCARHDTERARAIAHPRSVTK